MATGLEILLVFVAVLLNKKKREVQNFYFHLVDVATSFSYNSFLGRTAENILYIPNLGRFLYIIYRITAHF